MGRDRGGVAADGAVRAIRAAWLVATGACVAWTMVLLAVFVKAGISAAVTLPELLAKLPGL